MLIIQRTLLLLALMLVLPVASAQSPENPPPLEEVEGWRSRLVGTISGSQVGFHNWQEGGANSLAATAGVTGRFERVLGRLKQTHDMRAALGVIKQDSLRARKAVDDVRYSADVQLRGFGPLQPTLAAEIRTQFAPGFDYGGPEPVKVSDFFAPAQLTQSVGATFEPVPWFRTRLGLGLKQTVVTIERLRPAFGNRPDQQVRVESGVASLTEVNREIVRNVHLKSRLSLFYAFVQLERPPDAIFENQVKMRVNDHLNVTFEFVSLFDRSISNRIQLREMLSVGVSVALM
jgi:hypothetical protein